MDRLKKKWIYAASSALLLAFLLFGVRQIWAQQTNPLLSEQEVKQIISNAYAGKVERIQLNEHSNPPQYVAKLKNGDRWYELHVGGYNGDILHLKQINESGVPMNPNKPGKDNPGTGQPTNPNKPGNGSTPITKEEAKQIAKTQFNGKLSSLELKIQPDGSRYYQAKLENNKESIIMYINEANGEVLKKEITSKPNKQPTNNTMPITESEAKSIALKHVKGTIKSIELDDENGVPVYEVEVKMATGTKKVYINAYSGAVISTVSDDDDDDDSDDDDTASKKEVKGVSTDNKNNSTLNSKNTNKNNNAGSIVNKPSKPTTSKPTSTNNTNNTDNNHTNNNGSSTDTNTPVNNDDDQVGSQPSDDNDDDDDDGSSNDSNNTSNNSSNNSNNSSDDDDDDY
ncbi:PepSY domain-containing protein [Paenibacillus assamensis]|uniref:PepSY domain-containing protein n=1 Tax=Paenibacillus assamensis TaxID=311244 RepID=UPI000428AAD6|nr:PepSY domain-containing protein [Paenibacillus assamensis]